MSVLVVSFGGITIILQQWILLSLEIAIKSWVCSYIYYEVGKGILLPVVWDRIPVLDMLNQITAEH